MKENFLKVFLCLTAVVRVSRTDEQIYSLNGKRPIHKVDTRYLGISIDPAVLMSSLNLSDTSLQLASRLSPAYIRIAGPSTQFMSYDPDAVSEDQFDDVTGNVIITPSMWFGINEWLAMANLTPIFGINDVDRTDDGLWNPRATLPLLEISDKFNITCLWQLGYDCTNKSATQYRQDLLIFRHILDAFPSRRRTWRIVGSNWEQCATDLSGHMRLLSDLGDDTLAAIMWEHPYNFGLESSSAGAPAAPKPGSNANVDIMEQAMQRESVSNMLRLANAAHPPLPIWTTTAKSMHPVCFASALTWAKEIGEAAKLGFRAVFRQPRIHEIFSDTPIYWVTILHKHLMGVNVLDVKPSSAPHNPHVSVFAHCSRHQNRFARRGAMTVLIVNNSTANHTTLLRFGSPSAVRSTEVQSYVLWSTDLDSPDIYLNDRKLGPDTVSLSDHELFRPRLRRAKVMNFLSLISAPKSIGFYVIPLARIPACILSDDADLHELLDEISHDQQLPLSHEVQQTVGLISSRINSPTDLLEGTPLLRPQVRGPTLKHLHELVEKELHNDENYYTQLQRQIAARKAKHAHALSSSTVTTPVLNALQNRDARTILLDLARLQGAATGERPTSLRTRYNFQPRSGRVLDLELTSAEIRKILTDRARARAAKKRIVFTSAELDEIMDKATERFLHNSSTTIRLSKAKRSVLATATNSNQPRHKRDINMELLKLKTAERLKGTTSGAATTNDKNRVHFKDGDRKEATMRQEGQTSAELIRQLDEEQAEFQQNSAGGENQLPSGNVYAEMAEDDLFDHTTSTTRKPLFNFWKPFARPSLTLPTFKPYPHTPIMPVVITPASTTPISAFINKPPILPFLLPINKKKTLIKPFLFTTTSSTTTTATTTSTTTSRPLPPVMPPTMWPNSMRNVDSDSLLSDEVEYEGRNSPGPVYAPDFMQEFGNVHNIDANREADRSNQLWNEGRRPHTCHDCELGEWEAFERMHMASYSDKRNHQVPAFENRYRNMDEDGPHSRSLSLDSSGSLDSADLFADPTSRQSFDVPDIESTSSSGRGDDGATRWRYKRSILRSDNRESVAGMAQQQLKALRERLVHRKRLDMINRYRRLKELTTHKRSRRSLLMEIGDMFRRSYDSLATSFANSWPTASGALFNANRTVRMWRNVQSMRQFNDSPLVKVFVGQNNFHGSRARRNALVDRLNDISSNDILLLDSAAVLAQPQPSSNDSDSSDPVPVLVVEPPHSNNPNANNGSDERAISDEAEPLPTLLTENNADDDSSRSSEQEFRRFRLRQEMRERAKTEPPHRKEGFFSMLVNGVSTFLKQLGSKIVHLVRD